MSNNLNDEYLCEICGKTIKTLKSLKIHFTRMHNDEDFYKYCEDHNFGHKCKNCGKMVTEEFCDIKCNVEYKRKIDAINNPELYKFECKECGKKYKDLCGLSYHISSEHKDLMLEGYYKKYLMKEGDPDGHCLWCGKELKFKNLTKGYDKFCYNKECNVLWYNKNTDRKIKADEKTREVFKRGDVIPKQKGYWIKRGYTEEQAILKIKELQVINSVEEIMKRKKCSIEEAKKFRQEITDKWQATLNAKSDEEKREINRRKIPTQRNPISISQAEYELAEILNCEQQLVVNIGKTPQHFVYDLYKGNKIIEYNGDYWHCNPIKYDKDYFNEQVGMIAEWIWKRDEFKIDYAKEVGYDILVIWEYDYKNNKEETIKKCLEFLQE